MTNLMPKQYLTKKKLYFELFLSGSLLTLMPHRILILHTLTSVGNGGSQRVYSYQITWRPIPKGNDKTLTPHTLTTDTACTKTIYLFF